MSQDEDLSEEDLEDGQEGAAPLASPSGRPLVYRHDEIHDKLEDIMWDNVPWVEAQAITGTSTEQVANVDDDLERELSFYNQV